MKVAYFALGETYNSPHAGFVHTYNIVKSLSRYLDIELFINGQNQKTDIPTTFVSLPSVKLKNPFDYAKNYDKLKKHLKDFDIVHERFHINPIDLLFVGDKKYVLEVNDPAPAIYSGLKGKIYSKIINKKFASADALITQTETLKKILSKFYSGRIYVVANGVDIKFFEKNKCKFDMRKRYGIKKEQIVITFTGSFREWHGVHHVPYISEEIGKEFKNVIFLLVGSGPLFKDIEKNKKGNMILTGSVSYEDIPTILNQSDILIAPFSTEKFSSLEKYGFYWCPVKLFEYMASGKPIVSYDYEEIRKITEGASLLAKPCDLQGLIKNIEKLIINKNLRRRLGNYGKERSKHYGWYERAKDIAEIYREIL